MPDRLLQSKMLKNLVVVREGTAESIRQYMGHTWRVVYAGWKGQPGRNQRYFPGYGSHFVVLFGRSLEVSDKAPTLSPLTVS